MSLLGGVFGGWQGTVISGVACLGLGFGAGWKVHDWRDAHAAVKQAVAVEKKAVEVKREERKDQQAAEATAAAVIVYKDRVQHDVVTLHEQHYVPLRSSTCVVPLGFLRWYNSSARDNLGPADQEPASTAGLPDAAPSGVDFATVGDVTARNNGQCRAQAGQLNGLIDFVQSTQPKEK